MSQENERKTLIIGSEGNGVKWGKKLIEYLIKKAFTNCSIEYKMSLDCDIIVMSHFFNKEALWNKQKKKYIYWSGESYDVMQRSHAESAIHMVTSFESSAPEDENLYIPYVLYSPCLYKERKYKNDISNRKYLVAYCSSNNTNKRESLYNCFVETLGKDSDMCHALGRCYGNYKNTQKKVEGNWEDETLIDAYKDYKFVFALENINVDGYVTEKILNAFYSGAIPIYWGSSNINDLFNKNAFINVADYETLEECVNHVIKMSSEELQTMQNEAIYNEKSEIIHLMDEEFYSKHGNKTLDSYVEMFRNFLQD